MAPFTPEENAALSVVLQAIGMTLIECQAAEKSVLYVILVVFPKHPFSTLEELKANERLFDGPSGTLGSLLKALRDKAKIDQSFDDVLREFLKERNTLAHNLSKVSPHAFGASVWRDEMMSFLTTLRERARAVFAICNGYLVEWSRNLSPEGFKEVEKQAKEMGIYQELQGTIASYPAVSTVLEKK